MVSKIHIGLITFFTLLQLLIIVPVDRKLYSSPSYTIHKRKITEIQSSSAEIKSFTARGCDE
jgi:hypothetical protein